MVAPRVDITGRDRDRPPRAGVTACSLSGGNGPSQIVLPPTDQLTTESDVPSTSTTTASITNTATELPDWSIGRVVSLAPRADNSNYHDGATGSTDPLQETSGFHFSTPDRNLSCSTGTNGRATLACRINNAAANGTPPASESSTCQWAANLITLSADGPTHGACSNEYPVLYRSSIVDFGTTIAVGRFQCLVSPSGTYCSSRPPIPDSRSPQRVIARSTRTSAHRSRCSGSTTLTPPTPAALRPTLMNRRIPHLQAEDSFTFFADFRRLLSERFFQVSLIRFRLPYGYAPHILAVPTFR